MSYIGIAVTFVLLVSACSMNQSTQEHARQDFDMGVKSYEEGDFKTAVAVLQHALNDGLHSKSDQVSAHKYLAFFYCISGREKECRNEFKTALQIDPTFDLKPEEAGHPLWGPAFRGEKAKFSK